VRRRLVIVTGLLAASCAAAGLVVAAVGPVGAVASSPVGTWSAAVNVPGTSPVNSAEITDVSCAPGAECVAVGDGIGAGDSPFIISERNGAWSKAALVPGLAKLGGGADITSVSCPASGDCLVAGQYGDFEGDSAQGWYAQEVKGTWGTATPIPGLAHLNTGGYVDSIVASCPSPGNCALAGGYTIPTSASLAFNGFVASEAGYTWTSAAPVPGLTSLMANGSADISALSCASPGNCAVGGEDLSLSAAGVTRSAAAPGLAGLRPAGLGSTAGPGSTAESGRAANAFLRSRHLLHSTGPADATPIDEPFVASEVNGVWQAAQAPALGLTSTGDGFLTAVACPAAGACIASGFYSTSDAATAVGGSFLVSQSGTTWSKPDRSSFGYVGAVDCRSAGNCAAAVVDARGIPAVVAVVNGTWGKLTELPGTTRLTYKGAKLTFVLPEVLACPTAGNCSVGSSSFVGTSSIDPGPSILSSEANGSWSAAREPGLALGDGVGGFWGMACASVANCAAGGGYETANFDAGAFTMVDVPVRATATTLTRSHSIVTYGAEQRETLTVKVTAKAGTPGGRVTIKAGTATVCVITLKAGTGSCTLTAKQFKAGGYHLVASYGGSWPYGGSASASWPLTVQA
jgi:hypothetical protein